ncbi:copper resistance CopC family protein [Microbacterium sp. 3J1]|uniref:copper resistance CopC family protein n=1 Tax=Microbacterium sp. 3J1 TaxID=861269 RepID=UPI000B24EEA8|nr:copper resistance CopC family protein [Microbacterium sp. 3J1]
MKTAARPSPAGPIALAAALLTALLVLVAPLPASAHDSLIASSPEADSTVDTLPDELTLTFSAKLIDGEGATEVVVTDPSGASATDGAATVDGAIVTQPLVDGGVAGQYHVIWKIVSSDGHPTSGEFDFTVANASTDEPSAAPTASPTTEPDDATATTSPSTAAPSPDETAPSGEDSSATTWIWILSIAGVLVAAAVAVLAFALKGRGSGSEDAADGDSDESTER